MKKTAIIFTILLLITACATGFKHVVIEQHFKLSQFISAETCGGCHTEIYKQWKGSMHHQAHNDPIYRSVSKYLLQGLTKKAEIEESESCVKCHTPVGVTTGFPLKRSDDHSKTPALAAEGIQCDYCHSSVKAYKMFNNGLVKEPGQGDENPGTKRGPFGDSKSDYHKTAYSKFHTSSEICGTCHNVRHIVYGTWLETTYEEWQQSAYNSSDPKKHVPCQGCHMYQKPGLPATGSTPRPKNPGKASDDGPERPHIFTHYFVGANSGIPALNKDEIKSTMAVDRLQNSAELSADTAQLNKGILKINVKNTGAGHKLPTGLTDIRQMWLEIFVQDDAGKIYHRSGFLDTAGTIPPGTILYNTVFGDKAGRVVTNISQAEKILSDNRIAPGKTATETIRLSAPMLKNGTVSVRLLYRSAPQHIIDAAMGKNTIKLPVVQMKSLNTMYTAR